MSNIKWQQAMDKWQACDGVLVKMLADVARKAAEFLQDPDVHMVDAKEVWVDEIGRYIKPENMWLLSILATWIHQDGDNGEGKGYELPIRALYETLVAPSRRESLESFKAFLADYMPGAN